jgi:hypothetical protein
MYDEDRYIVVIYDIMMRIMSYIVVMSTAPARPSTHARTRARAHARAGTLVSIMIHVVMLHGIILCHIIQRRCARTNMRICYIASCVLVYRYIPPHHRRRHLPIRRHPRYYTVLHGKACNCITQYKLCMILRAAASPPALANPSAPPSASPPSPPPRRRSPAT